MWASIKTEAIILSVAPWREADRRYCALTPGHGKLEFFGRGAGKPLAKLASHLDPCTILDLEIIRGARSVTVIGVERRQSFSTLSTSLDHRLLALTSLGLLDKIIREEQEDAVLYGELTTWLKFLDTQESLHPTRSTFLLSGFLLRLMRQLGYNVALDHCVGCEGDILPLSFRWHGGRGGLVCSSCIATNPGEWFLATPLRQEVVQLMRLARDSSYDGLYRYPLKGADVSSLASCLHDTILYHVPGATDRPFWTGILPLQTLAIPPLANPVPVQL